MDTYFIPSPMYPDCITIHVKAPEHSALHWLFGKGIGNITVASSVPRGDIVKLRLTETQMDCLTDEDRAEFVMRFC